MKRNSRRRYGPLFPFCFSLVPPRGVRGRRGADVNAGRRSVGGDLQRLFFFLFFFFFSPAAVPVA